MDSDIQGYAEASQDIARASAVAWADMPTSLDSLPDGTDTVVIGDVDGMADYNHKQGDNDYNYQGTCGLVSCEDVLGQFGVDVSENDLVEYAASNQLCTVSDDPSAAGGTTAAERVQLLDDYGVPAHVETDRSLEDLASDVEHGSGVIIAANAGVLWDDANAYDNGGANHAVTVTGVARDPDTGEIHGFFINDSGTGDSGRFVDASTMTTAYIDAGGEAVVTDYVHSGSSDDD